MLASSTPEAVPLPVFRGEGGFRPGVDPLSNRSLLDAVELDAVELDAVDDDSGGSGS